jgi:S-formylglutathione hydrolase FrmB
LQYLQCNIGNQNVCRTIYGGYGALRLAEKYGNRFKAVSGISSITDGEQLINHVEEDITDLLKDNVDDINLLVVINGPIGKKIYIQNYTIF